MPDGKNEKTSVTKSKGVYTFVASTAKLAPQVPCDATRVDRRLEKLVLVSQIHQNPTTGPFGFLFCSKQATLTPFLYYG